MLMSITITFHNHTIILLVVVGDGHLEGVPVVQQDVLECLPMREG